MTKIKTTYKELAIEFKKTRNEKIYNKLYAKMRPGLRSYVNNIVKDSNVTEDIVSTTLTTVYLKIDQYNEDYQITTWAYRIAYNECIGWIRLRNRKVSMNTFTDKGIDPPTFMLSNQDNGIDNGLPWSTEMITGQKNIS